MPLQTTVTVISHTAPLPTVAVVQRCQQVIEDHLAVSYASTLFPFQGFGLAWIYSQIPQRQLKTVIFVGKNGIVCPALLLSQSLCNELAFPP